jgi:hypothetical protein
MKTRFGANYQVLSEAIHLLDDNNLVWSSELELIRQPLSAWLANEARHAYKSNQNAIKIAKLLTAGQDQVMIMDWLESIRKGQ